MKSGEDEVMYAFMWFFLFKVLIFGILECVLIGAIVNKIVKSGTFWVLTGLIIVIGLTSIFPQCLMLAGIYIGILVAVWIGILINNRIARIIWGMVSIFLLPLSWGMLMFATTTSNYYSYRVFYDENQDKHTVVELASRFSSFAVESVTINYYHYKGYRIFPSERYKDTDSSFEYRREIPESYEEFQRSIAIMEKQ